MIVASINQRYRVQVWESAFGTFNSMDAVEEPPWMDSRRLPEALARFISRVSKNYVELILHGVSNKPD
jgi:hypothetical protein